MHDALIGYTGFVGGNLSRQRKFDDFFNSRNIESIRGRKFDTVICAGAPAEKWKANQNPDADLTNINYLIDNLSQIEARQMILISTVDVYASPHGVDELTPIETTRLHAYGRHRRLLEECVTGKFNALIVRLPGLFGAGLKKNAIYDFMHDNDVAQVDSDGVFQFYGLNNLWRDIQLALSHGLEVINFATAPVSIEEIARAVFDREFKNRLDRPPANYDMKTRYDHLYGGAQGYLYSKEQILREMREFVAQCAGHDQ